MEEKLQKLMAEIDEASKADKGSAAVKQKIESSTEAMSNLLETELLRQVGEFENELKKRIPSSSLNE